ncbi:MAG: hypothetical protein ACFHWZ_08725 [Phycisphaerales bacterium]
MTTQEMIEMASLDALGMLDADERAEFEAAFRAASPSVQAQVRREQKRFADAEHLLPEVDPPAGMKFRVMSAIRDAIIGITAGDAEAATRAVSRGSNAGAWFNSTTIWRSMHRFRDHDDPADRRRGVRLRSQPGLPRPDRDRPRAHCLPNSAATSRKSLSPRVFRSSTSLGPPACRRRPNSGSTPRPRSRSCSARTCP